MLNYSDFLHALRLSTESYGFTQEQVAMQMDTIARKAEQFQQQLVSLSAGAGNLSWAFKMIIDAAREVVAIADRLSRTEVFGLVVTGVLLGKANAIAGVLKNIVGILGSMRALLVSIGTGNFLGKLGAASSLAGVLRLAGALAGIATAISIITEKEADARSVREGQAEEITSQIELEEELLNRKEQSLESVRAYAEGYRAISERLNEANLSEEERNKLLKDQQSTHEALVNIIGEEDAVNVEAHANESAYLDEIIGKHKEQIATDRSGLQEKAQGLKTIADAELEYTKQVAENLDIQKQGIGGVIEELIRLGRWWDAIMLKLQDFNRSFDSAMLKNHTRRLQSLQNMKKQGLTNEWGLLGELVGAQSIDEAIAEEQELVNKYSSAVDEDTKSINGAANRTKGEEVTKGLQNIQRYNANMNSILGNGFNQTSKGGSEIDESGGSSGGSGKKGKKRVFDMEGNEIRIPNASNYATEDGVDRNVTQDTELKLRILDEAFYRKFGQHLLVSSMKRNRGDGSKHDDGLAFDLVGDILENNPGARQWLSDYGSWIGLTALDEYLPENAHYARGGGNLHFSNNGASIYDILGSAAKTNADFKDNSVQRQLYDALKAENLSDKQAWAAMAAIGGESSFDPGAIQEGMSFEDPKAGIGLMQWTADRKQAYLGFVAQRAAMGGSSDWRDVANQLAFMRLEMNGNQAGYWNDYLNSVTADTSAEDDVRSFTAKVERAGIPNIANRMQYYGDISSHYVNGMSLYDSDPSKVKQLTPEQRAEKEAKRLQQYYNTLNKAADTLEKVVGEKYKSAMDVINEDQQLFGQNMENTGKQLDTYQAKLADDVNITEQYSKVLEKVVNNLSDADSQRLFHMSKDDFLKLELEEQQKLIAGIDAESALYKPILATLNEIVKVKQKIRESDEQYHKDQMEWVKLYQNRTKLRYDKPIQSENDDIREWEITHSNERYDAFYRNIFEQQHLEEIARLAKEKYDEMMKPILDAEGNPVYDRAGNQLFGGSPEEIEKQKQAWLEADAAAKKYAATLKNDVNQQFTEFAKSVLIQGESLRDKLKNLWKQLGEDALTLLLSGGKEGTNSLLGNILRQFVNRHRDQKDQFLDGPYGYKMPYDTTFTTYATGPMSAYMSNGTYRPSMASWGQAIGATEPVVGVDPLTGNHFPTVNTATLANPTPVYVTNAANIAGGIGSAVNSLADGLPAGTAIPNPQYSFGENGSVTSMANILQGSTGFATKYNWGMPSVGSGGWGDLALGSKLGIFASTLPWLFSLFKHHASGGKVDKEEIATLGENDQTEYVIPTEQNRPRGVALWKQAGEDLGVLSKGSPVVPNFKNKELATRGVMSVQVKQQAVYMEQMKRQNQTLLNILSAMANNQSNNGGGGTAVMQPVVVKQSMDMNEFTRMYQKGKSYNYLK